MGSEGVTSMSHDDGATVPGAAETGSHAAADEGGHGHPGDHGHGSAPLGPIDVRAWGAGLVGVLAGLVTALVFAFSTGRL